MHAHKHTPNTQVYNKLCNIFITIFHSFRIPISLSIKKKKNYIYFSTYSGGENKDMKMKL